MNEVIPFYNVVKRIDGKAYYVPQPKFLNIKKALEFGETLGTKYTIREKYLSRISPEQAQKNLFIRR